MTPQLHRVAAAPEGEPLSRPGMIWIAGGTFRMGSDRHYPEEAPAHPVSVDGFWIDRTPVTNRQFRQFVKSTGYVTFAEIAPNPADYPGALPGMLRAGSLVFAPPQHEVDLRDWSRWWTFKPVDTSTCHVGFRCVARREPASPGDRRTPD